MLALKTNVRFKDPVFAITVAIMVAHEVYREIGVECIVTSANDSIHSKTSFHYKDAAVDLRIKNVPPSQQDAVFNRIRERLNDSYDVLFEGRGTSNAHIHIEHDPT